MSESAVDWAVATPAQPLQGFVDRYIGYRLVGVPGGVHRGLPSRHLTLIASIGAPIDVLAQTDPRQSPDRYRVVVSGLQARPALIANDGPQEGVAIELTPLGARALLAMPAAAIWDTSLELADVAGPIGGELWERLQQPASWRERFAICDAVLGRLLGEDRVEPALGRAWNIVTRGGGTIAVEELARTVGWSRQHLARRFATEFGLTPKLASRVARFDRARWMLQAPGPLSLGRVAAACGYADQAHMTNEFRLLAECPPARLLADEQLPNLQDDGSEPLR